MPLHDCGTAGKELYNYLNEQGYSEEIVTAANDLNKLIAEYDKKNPKNMATVKNYESKETADGESEDKEVEVETEEKESESEDMTKLPLAEHKKAMKKKGLVIVIE